MSLASLIAAEREIFTVPVRRRVCVAPTADVPDPNTRSMGEMRFLVWNRERLPLPGRVRTRDFSGMMTTPRSFSTEMNLVAVAEHRVPGRGRELPEEILIPFYWLDPVGERDAEILYQPACPFEHAGDVLQRLGNMMHKRYMFADVHMSEMAVYHLLSVTDRGIIYEVPEPAPYCTLQVNNYLVFLTEEECEPERSPHRVVTRRFIQQMRRYSGLPDHTIDVFADEGILVDDRGRSLRRMSRMLTPAMLPVFPHDNPRANNDAESRWLLRFKPANNRIRFPIWDDSALEPPTEEMIHLFRGFHKLQEEWVEALHRSYRTIRSLTHVSPHAVIERDPDCPWKGTLRFQMEFVIPEGRSMGLHYEIVSSLFPERFPRWDMMFRATLSSMEARTNYGTAEQPAGLGLDLFSYQLDTLGFLLAAEQGEGMHTQLWERVGELYFSPCFQQVRASLAGVPVLPRGGFVCEEVGLGKTIEMLALVRANPAPEELPPPVEGGLRPSRATVIVCPVTIVAQWIQMVDRILVRPSAEVVLYHGPKRPTSLDVLANAEIILTTYETLAKEYQRKEELEAMDMNEGEGRRTPPPMYALDFHRVVFDESHTVRSEMSGKGQACAALSASRRWCLTATPFRDEMSAHQDLRAQCAMLHHTLRNVPLTWRSMLYTLGVRHSKEQVQALMPPVPEKQEHVIPVPMNEADRAIYNDALQVVRREFDRVRTLMQDTHNTAGLMRYMMSVFAPLRVFCSTGRMPRIPIREDLGAVQQTEVVEGDVPDEDCPICFTPMEEPHRTPCNHWFCRACITDWLTAAHGNHKCPMCRHPLQLSQLVRVIRPEEAAAAAAPPANEGDAAAAQAAPAPPPLPRAEGNLAKLTALLQSLDALCAAEPDAKFLLFSQYKEGLHSLQEALRERGIGFRCLDGSMTLLRRSRAIRDFEADAQVKCMLLDVRTASFGLNLTRAHHVLFLDTPTNPAAVRQAVGRAHRTGQRQVVHVRHFVLQGTVEERILEEGMTSVGFPELPRLLAP